jgi:hypothetical protein
MTAPDGHRRHEEQSQDDPQLTRHLYRPVSHTRCGEPQPAPSPDLFRDDEEESAKRDQEIHHDPGQKPRRFLHEERKECRAEHRVHRGLAVEEPPRDEKDEEHHGERRHKRPEESGRRGHAERGKGPTHRDEHQWASVVDKKCVPKFETARPPLRAVSQRVELIGG